MGQVSVLTLLYTLKPHEIYLQEVGSPRWASQ